ncbi:hypothetical protein CHS0354_031565 [Potamilus streckersoni]|uniref:Secreted protein n=1 Tax=Potamilus streckersoni TaxID=2493646 RepID=A0AAE0SYQ9_9BIVA|nr:hypothetical protein CHS0354_031565 [Potamilus streckersoni]
MKSLPLLYICTLLLLLQNYSYANIIWDCYHWTARDNDLIRARGSASKFVAERKVCVDIRGHLFTGGVDSLAPGCGKCWCCQKLETRWTCHQWTESERTQIENLGGTKEAQRQVCDAKTGYVFTAGVNSLTPGCGSCWCCGRV